MSHMVSCCQIPPKILKLNFNGLREKLQFQVFKGRLHNLLLGALQETYTYLTADPYTGYPFKSCNG